ncbi:MAG TPA: NUDIX hydrolase [Propionibacteriaceae bacterium]|nr:NUDIX hydrolase [Propionibacteriaceae bacterium]
MLTSNGRARHIGVGMNPNGAKPILAGGAVVTREHPTRGTEVVIVHRKRYDDWSLPKGKLLAGESIPAATVREVWEETGVKIRLSTPLDTIKYETSKGTKRVDYWVGTVLDIVRRAPDAEVDVVAWLPLRAAMSRLTYAHDHFLLTQFREQPTTTPLILVRHGKAMDRKDWSKKDALRPMASRGRSQAKLLVPMLEAFGVCGLISSTSLRCVTTLAPYAERHNLTIERYSKLSEEEGADDGRAVKKVISAIRDRAVGTGQPLAICVHRPVLPHILDALEMAPINLVTGEFVVAHLTDKGEVHAVERHRPSA